MTEIFRTAFTNPLPICYLEKKGGNNDSVNLSTKHIALIAENQLEFQYQ